MRQTIGLIVLLIMGEFVAAQPPISVTPPPTALKPPGGDTVFGAAPDQAFTPKALFPTPATVPAYVRPPAAPKPASEPPPPPQQSVYAGPGEALFPPAPPPPPPLPPIWTGGGEFGLNGATGNAELFNMRIALNARRRTERNIFTTDYLHTFTTQDSNRTLNQALWNARDELLFGNSPWSLFSALQIEYDQFRGYDFRVGVYGGAGYTVFDDEDGLLKFRVGAGAVRELSTRADGPPPRWVPEAVFGFDYRAQLSERGAILSMFDYYPRIDDWSQFRIRARLGYEHILDPENGMVLRLGLQNRYDSSPGANARRNDLTYFTTLGMQF